MVLSARVGAFRPLRCCETRQLRPPTRPAAPNLPRWRRFDDISPRYENLGNQQNVHLPAESGAIFQRRLPAAVAVFVPTPPWPMPNCQTVLCSASFCAGGGSDVWLLHSPAGSGLQDGVWGLVCVCGGPRGQHVWILGGVVVVTVQGANGRRMEPVPTE